MSNIAQRLCHDIVNPALKLSSSKISPQKEYATKQNGSASKAVIDRKKKTISNLNPTSLHKSSTSHLKSTEIISRRQLAEIGVNTYVSGPWRCNNNAVTLVRKRESHCNCKCALNRHPTCKFSAKQIQTAVKTSFSLTDKACAQCVETFSCGTQSQFLEKGKILDGKAVLKNLQSNHNKHVLDTKAPFQYYYHSDIKSQMDSVWKKQDSGYKDIDTGIELHPRIFRPITKERAKEETSAHHDSTYLGARRWALSKYPVRGPDF